jgi:hypothetical protein
VVPVLGDLDDVAQLLELHAGFLAIPGGNPSIIE